MLIYDKLIETFSDALGPEFVLEYNNNENFNWAEVLTESLADGIYGVLRVDSGQDRIIGDQTIKIDTMHISFAIVNDKETFNHAIEKIEEVRDSLNNTTDNLSNTQVFKILMGGRSDAAIERINGRDWVITDLYFQAQVYTSIFTSSNRVFEIKNDSNVFVPLKGILNTIYDFKKQFDSYVNGIDDPVATNKVNNIQYQFVVELVPSADDTMLASILNNHFSDDTYTIKYSDGIFTATYSMQLAQINEKCITGDIFTLQITFVNK